MMRVSSNGPCCLRSIDVSNASLLVPQQKQTMVKLKVCHTTYQVNALEHTIASKHLENALKEKNMVPDIGLPPLFYKKRNENPILLHRHVHDLQMLGTEEDKKRLIEFLQKEKGWKLKVIGPVYPTERECNFLERAFPADSEAIHVKPNVKYGEKLADFGLENRDSTNARIYAFPS